MDGEAFYRQLDEGLFEATKWTRGPWNPEHQHAGPPSALVAGQLAAMWSDAFRVVRVSIEIPRPLPIGGLRLERSLRRDGSMVKVATGRLFDDAGKLVLSAEALALAEAELDLEGTQPPMEETLPSTGRAERFPFFDEGSNYAAAMELRFTRGGFGDGDVMGLASHASRTRASTTKRDPSAAACRR